VARALAVGALAGAVAAACGAPRPAARRDRDVVLITVDTLRADRVGAYGWQGARTPHMDGLARAGTTFLQATTPFPRTTPALASLLTGLWPHHHGSREVGAPMQARPTLAESLSRRGYATLAVSANGAAGPAQRLDLGFARFVDRAALGSDRAELVSERALALLREVPRARPVLLWVHYVDPHFPYEPPAAFRDGARGEACRALAGEMRSRRVRLAHVHNDRDAVASRVLDDCLAAYDGEVAYTDAEIGRLLEGLRALGRYDQALVVLTADHGENMGEDGLYYEHGPSVHDSSLRVPLIVVGAGPPGRVDRGVARLEDVMPTLLSLLGEPAAAWPAMDGVDLSRRLQERPPFGAAASATALAEAGSDLFVESHQQVRSGRPRGMCCLNAPRFSLCEKPDWDWPRLFDRSSDPGLRRDVSGSHRREKRELMRARRLWPVGEARQRTARTAEYKLVERPRWQGGYQRSLYALAADPGEARDLSGARPDVVELLARALDPWAAQVAASARERGEPPSEPPAEQEQLRALGYVQ
jgi:arylsulfatase